MSLSLAVCVLTLCAWGLQNGLANYPYIGGVVGPTNSRVNGNDLGDSSNVLYVAGVSEGASRPARVPPLPATVG